MPRGNFSKGRRSTSSRSGGRSYTARSGSRSTKRRSGGRGAARSAPVKMQTLRIVFAQEPGGASLANPALPIPPSVTPDTKRKAKL